MSQLIVADAVTRYYEQHLARMAAWFRPVAALSSLNCTTELVRSAFGHPAAMPPGLCIVTLFLFSPATRAITATLHTRDMPHPLFL